MAFRTKGRNGLGSADTVSKSTHVGGLAAAFETASGKLTVSNLDSGEPRDLTCPYPPLPRSGNAFAAAVFAAIPGLLLLIVLAWVFAQ